MGSHFQRALGCAGLCVFIGCGAQSTHKAPSNDGTGGQTAVTPTLLDSVSTRFPAAEASDACVDTQLRLTFNAPVTVGTAGKIQVFKASDPSTPIDAIDMAATDYTDQIGSRVFHTKRPVFVSGNEVIVYLHQKKLAAGESYFVNVDASVFVDDKGVALPGITDPSAWRFTTRSRAPVDPSQLSVALDGSGDFCSVQGAVDFVPMTNAAPVSINLKNGTYREIVFIQNKNQVTVRGEDRKKTIIEYENNDNLQLKGGTKVRAMFTIEGGLGMGVENLTLHNLTAVSGGSGNQAEALRIDPGQASVRHVDVMSLQDTLLLSGHVYFEDCYIEGNVDFVWGRGVAYFEGCELKTVQRGGYEVQARNAPNQYGFIFVDSKLTSTPGVQGNYLGRIDATVYPGSQVAYLNCQMGSHIDPVGWVVTPVDATIPADLRFWEYQSTDLDGQPLDVSLRHVASRQLSESEANVLRDKVTILGFDPSLPP